MLIDFAQQKMWISVPLMQASVWAAVRMLALHTSTVPIWRLRQYRHETKSAPGGVEGGFESGSQGGSFTPIVGGWTADLFLRERRL